MCYILCYLTETSMVMNCDVGATIALSLLVTTNATLFTDKYTKTVTNTFLISSSHHLILFPPSCPVAFCHPTINEYVMLCYVMLTIFTARRGLSYHKICPSVSPPVTLVEYTVSQKTVQTYFFCQNFVKFRPIAEILAQR